MKRSEKIFSVLALLLLCFNAVFIVEFRRIRTLQDNVGKNGIVSIATVNTGFRELKSSDEPPLTQSEPPPDDAPLFVLHIGPPKTGTTTIQWAGRNYPGLLEKDNFYFLGNQQNIPEKLLHEMVRNCRDWIKPDCENKWEEFAGIVKTHLDKKQNVFMSEELLNVCARPDTENSSLWKYMIPIMDGWNVRIVYTYRRLSDWLPSKYHQAYSFDVPEHRKFFRDNWPDDRGRVIESFSSFFDSLIIQRAFQLPPAVLHRWRERFPHADFRVFNMQMTGSTNDHKPSHDDFLREFFCQIIPEARKLCKFLTKQDVNEKTMLNPSSSKNPHFDMLAVGAYQQGLIDKSKNVTRADATSAAEAQARILGLNRVVDFPLECISEEQSQLLLNLTLEYEKQMVPKEFYLSSRGEKEIRTQFAAAKENGKYCSIHVKRTLRQSKWRKFFQSV